jgi:hypothetical protein
VNVLDRVRATHDEERSGYEAVRVSGGLADHLAGTADRDAVTVRPDKDNGGIEAMDEVLEALHTVETASPALRSETKNVSPAHAFEMRYAASDPASERVVTLQYVPGSDGLAGTLRRQLQSQYPDSHVDTTTADLLPAVGPRADRGRDGDNRERYVAGATLTLRRYTLYPIKNVDLPGFRSDPTGSVLEEMVGAQEDADTDADVAVQIMFKPATREWTQGVPEGHGSADAGDERINGAPGIKDLSYNLTQPTYEKSPLPAGTIPGLGWIPKVGYEVLEQPPTKVDKQVAKLLEEQQGEKGWRLCLRVLAVSAEPDTAITRAAKTAGMFRNFYESNTEQTFVPESLTGDALAAAVARAGRREYQEAGIVKAQREVAGLVNVPAAEHVTTNKLRWSLSRPGEGIPPGTPRFDFDAAEVAGADRDVQQVAMLDEGTPGDPYWYGFGSRHGIEAGVEPSILKTHQFVGGGTGVGKTTFLTNFVSQIMQRGHGALIFDPKGTDADAFVREWPEDRDEEDFVFVDLSDDYEQQVRFNFLEVPGDAEQGSRAFSTAVEALADDLVAMAAQAGGQDNYWGARMDRVLRTLIRGFARSGRTCTLLDLACCCTAPENRDRFAEWMTEERIHFIADTAEQISEMDEGELEPLAGRLEQWLQNDAIRNLISARESTVSIQDAVEDGTVLVVRNAPQSGETEKRLFATALIRRAWVAVRAADDAPPFYVVCDEFDSIVTEESNIHGILSEARAFDFPLTLACQNPSNQLPEQVQKAIENQCETFVSYNPGGQDDARLIAAQHSPGVDWEDLVNMSPYKFYMRTRDADDELTHSYKVDAFPPIAEARADVSGDPGMTDDELEALKQRSVKRYGTRPSSPEEQKAQSHFYGAGAAGDQGDGLDITDAVERAAVQGIYDTACRTGNPDGFVPLGDARPAVVRRVSALDETPDDVTDRLGTDGDLWRQVMQHVPDGLLEIREHDGGPELRATSPRATLATVGENQSAGGAGHGLLLWDAYAPLAWAGLDVEILDASGDDPDALVRPAPPEEQHAPALVEQLTGGDVARLEAEHSTGRSKAGMTAQHVLQAATEGRQAVVLARPDDAANVADTLRADPAFCRSDHPVDGEVRYYTSPRDLRVDGEAMTRPGGRSNAWIKDEETGDVVLRDGSGTEHARFEDAGAVFTDADSYPSGGDRTVKKPIIPEITLDGGAVDPHAEILEVPEGADDLADLSLRIGTDMTVPADAVGGGDRDAGDHPAGDDGGIPAPDDLDVPATAARFYDHLRSAADAGAGVSVKEAQDLAAASGDPKLDVSRRAMQDWLSALVDQGALRREDGDHAADPTTYHPR